LSQRFGSTRIAATIKSDLGDTSEAEASTTTDERKKSITALPHVQLLAIPPLGKANLSAKQPHGQTTNGTRGPIVALMIETLSE
jgi:hypothetical protein